MFDVFARPVGKAPDGGPTGYVSIGSGSASWAFGMRFPGKDRAWVKAARKEAGGETLVIDRDGAIVLMNSLRIPPLTSSLDAVTAHIREKLPVRGEYLLLGAIEGRDRRAPEQNIWDALPRFLLSAFLRSLATQEKKHGG
ncbi:hypothetical protein [Enterovirga rhinocerotis]|nr:hypothetical protein [Enterovirga rhinocerotis]